MHRLHLLRHAKSSWKDDEDDHARPLSRRGREAAARLRASLPRAVGRLDLVLCSSAQRTRETFDLALVGFIPPPQCLVEDGLYLASQAKLLRRLCRLDEAVGSVLVIGHNPGLQDLAAALAAPQSPGYAALAEGKFPTAALASFRVLTPWAGLDREPHELDFYPSPGGLDDDEG